VNVGKKVRIGVYMPVMMSVGSDEFDWPDSGIYEEELEG